MNEFKVEYFIVDDNEENIEISNLNKKETEEWKKDMEARGLSEYYSTKIKIQSKKT